MVQISYGWVMLCGFLWMMGCQSNLSEPQPQPGKPQPMYFLNPADSMQVSQFLHYAGSAGSSNAGRTTSDGDHYNNLAVVKYLAGQYEQALEHNNQALALRAGDAFATAKSHNNLAAVYQALGEYERALELYRAAADQLGALGKTEWHTHAQANYTDLAAWLSARGAHQGARVMSPPGQDRPIPMLFVESESD